MFLCIPKNMSTVPCIDTNADKHINRPIHGHPEKKRNWQKQKNKTKQNERETVVWTFQKSPAILLSKDGRHGIKSFLIFFPLIFVLLATYIHTRHTTKLSAFCWQSWSDDWGECCYGRQTGQHMWQLSPTY